MKSLISISEIILLIGSIFLFHSCTEEKVPPVVTTIPVNEIHSTSAVSGGAVTNEGGAAISGRGVCWSTSATPTIANNKTTETGGFGAFTSNITQLTPGMLYYVRAWATNSVGTGYGNQITFTAKQVAAPILTTTVITSVTQKTAVSGGNITNDNGGPVTGRGICWGTAANPTIALITKTSDGQGSGIFISNITLITPGTLYYVRAYATNSAGTSYGNQVTFTSSMSAIATLSTTAITSITTIGAVSGGNITNDNGADVTARGICWSTTIDPTTALSTKTIDGIGPGIFTSSLIGLQPGLNYYVRAYATNSVGTAYGNQLSFVAQISDVEGNKYNTVKIGTQVWMAENLKTTKYNDFTSIPSITDNPLPGYCWYNNDAVTYKAAYGALYNWYSINTAANGGKNVCPAGWHVPADAEWTILTTYLGGINVAGGKLKESGTTHWLSPNTGATNEYVFNAIPGGLRGLGGGFGNIGGTAFFWSVTANDASSSWSRDLLSGSSAVVREAPINGYGLSVRCLRDN